MPLPPRHDPKREGRPADAQILRNPTENHGAHRAKNVKIRSSPGKTGQDLKKPVRTVGILSYNAKSTLERRSESVAADLPHSTSQRRTRVAPVLSRERKRAHQRRVALNTPAPYVKNTGEGGDQIGTRRGGSWPPPRRWPRNARFRLVWRIGHAGVQVRNCPKANLRETTHPCTQAEPRYVVGVGAGGWQPFCHCVRRQGA